VPWALRIDADHSPDGRPGTFHPTFLYESLCTLALAGLLLLIDRRRKVRPGHLMALYIIGYGIIRFFVEGMRIDEAHHVGGLRWNQWVAIAAIVGGGIYLLVTRNQPQPHDPTPPAHTDALDEPDDDAEDVTDEPVVDEETMEVEEVEME
jgi:prolipoprotein diacylglyceryltransferase